MADNAIDTIESKEKETSPVIETNVSETEEPLDISTIQLHFDCHENDIVVNNEANLSNEDNSVASNHPLKTIAELMTRSIQL